MSGSTEAVMVKEVEIHVGKSEVVPPASLNGSLQLRSFKFAAGRKKSLCARYSYGIIFLLMNLCAWSARDYGHKFFPLVHFLKACGNGGRDCFHTPGVLRTFFMLMFLTTFKTRKLYEARNAWHSKWWALKSLLLILSLVVPFLLSSDLIQIYGEIARIGAGIFLILQLISVIQFIAWWNNYWMPNDNSKKSCFLGLFMSTLLYILSICGIVFMYTLWSPKAACTLNIFFITWTVILLITMMVISLHSKVDRGLLSSGIMASYIVFLCWSAIRSEPANEKCNPQKQHNGNGDWTNVLSFLIAICAIVVATFSTGIDSKSFQFRKGEVQLEDDIPYKYGFFHMIFSLGAMYFAMLFINWNLYSSTRKWSIDVGWASTWVKIVNEWFAASIYLWKLVSPVVRQTGIMDHEQPVELMQSSNSPS